ncbi:MAG: Uma2 family endonuclease [Terracidiphilus sp.]|jgi:Uma2 family endonuclease
MATLPIYDDPQPEFVSVREYLTTSYRPDCDYVDGRIEERNVGEFDHSLLQALLAHLFMNHREEWGVLALPDVRVQVKATHFRVPDVTVLRAGTPREQILTHPPLLVIEILSPEDRLSRFTECTDEYLDFGIEHIWIVDPARRLVYRVTRTGYELTPSSEITVPGTPIRVVLSELFAELDRA